MNTKLSPDELVEEILKTEKKRHLGKLSIFLGMAPGVGKTYAMLLSAHEAKKDGKDIVVGVVETHHRKDTEDLLSGLELISKKKILYKNIELYEMDTDAILQRKPKIVLVDELAHTNIPGSRHEKRYQDVFELLEAGFDVYSTLNIQHLESRKKAIEDITDIVVSETVPDEILDRADQIRLIDLSVAELIKRLKEGKVYLGDNAKLAQSNFFKEENLTALRELSLRTTAQKVEREFSSSDARLKAGERILVLIDEDISSKDLLREAKTMAMSFDAPIVALYLDEGSPLKEEKKISLSANLDFAQSLSCNVISSASGNIVNSLKEIIKQKNITQIILDRKNKNNGEIIKNITNIKIIILPTDRKNKSWIINFLNSISLELDIIPYFRVATILLFISLFNSFLSQYIGYRVSGFIFLLFIFLAGMFISFGPMLFASISSLLIWIYFFIPPTGNFVIKEKDDFFMAISFIVSAICLGFVTSRMRLKEKLLLLRESKNRLLSDFSWDVSRYINKKDMFNEVIGKLARYLGGTIDILYKKRNGDLKNFINLKFSNEKKEMAIAKWVLDNGRPAGLFTKTLAGSSAVYLPMKGFNETVGVLAFRPEKKNHISQDYSDILNQAARQLGYLIEKELLLEKSHEVSHLRKMDREQRAILKYLSEELYALSSGPGKKNPKFEFLVKNFSLMSNIISGSLNIKKSTTNIKNLIDASIKEISEEIEERNNNISIRHENIKIDIDIELLKQALANILLNASLYSPNNSHIDIEAFGYDNKVEIRVTDQGTGIEEEHLDHIFDRFYRVPGSGVQGAGLGLAVAKGVVKAHGGKIYCHNRTDGFSGAVFSIVL